MWGQDNGAELTKSFLDMLKSSYVTQVPERF